MENSSNASVAVPTFVTAALSPAGSVVTLPTETVAALPSRPSLPLGMPKFRTALPFPSSATVTDATSFVEVTEPIETVGLSPLTPWGPWMPWSPCGPRSPWSPLSPLSPRSPWTPCSP